MRPTELKELLDKYARGTCTPEEARLVEDFYLNIATGEEPIELPGADFEEAAWARLRPEEVTAAGRKSLWLKVAASISIIAAAAALLYFAFADTTGTVVADASSSEQQRYSEKYENNTSRARKIRLDDGSYITLQPSGKVYFPRTFNKDKREVELHGEAFFEVSRDTLRPFIVYSGEVVTKVLGTSFNIRALDTDQEVRVSVKTGKVSVYKKPAQRDRSVNQPYILTPNQEVVFNRKEEKIVKQLVEKPEIILEKPTLFRMHYRNTPVIDLLDMIAENYGIEVRYDASRLDGCVLTTNMSEEDLHQRVQIICKAINATYTVENAVITIHADGCN